jgi:hypothetical protein
MLLSTKQFEGRTPMYSPGLNMLISSVRFLTAVRVIPPVTRDAPLGSDVILNVSDSR